MDAKTPTPDMSGGEETVSGLAALLDSAPADDRDRDKDPGTGDGKPADQATGGEEPAGDGPADEQVTGDEGDEGGDPGKDPVIAAPKSWPAEMRDSFAKLPPDLQRVIADRENERDAAFNRQVNEAADKRRAADAELQAAATERRNYLANLNQLIEGLARQTAGEFADIRTPEDLETLATTDPQRYLRWQARRDALQAAAAEQAAIADRVNAEQMRRQQSWMAEQRTKLLAAMPELADAAKAKEFVTESTAYLRDRGFTDQEIGLTLDHRYAAVIRDALAHRKAQQATKTAAEKKLATAPRLQRPGGARDSRGSRSPQEKAALTSIARHGTTDQIAEAMTRILEGR